MTHAHSPHALPLILRAPTQRLTHAREDHERCLRLAASYRVRLARGETEMRELHAWAIGHARILRNRFAGSLSTPAVSMSPEAVFGPLSA